MSDDEKIVALRVLCLQLTNEAYALRQMAKTLVAMPQGCRLVADRLEQVVASLEEISKKTPCACQEPAVVFLKEEEAHAKE